MTILFISVKTEQSSWNHWLCLKNLVRSLSRQHSVQHRRVSNARLEEHSWGFETLSLCLRWTCLIHALEEKHKPANLHSPAHIESHCDCRITCVRLNCTLQVFSNKRHYCLLQILPSILPAVQTGCDIRLGRFAQSYWSGCSERHDSVSG